MNKPNRFKKPEVPKEKTYKEYYLKEAIRRDPKHYKIYASKNCWNWNIWNMERIKREAQSEGKKDKRRFVRMR